MRDTSQQPGINEAIRATGRRVTMQRAKILAALRTLPGHSTAEQIHAQVSEEDRSAEMALSTVYRALDALADVGLVTAFATGGVTTYEWAAGDAPHHHLLCDGCGRTEAVALPSLAVLRAEVERDHGFAIDLRHMAIRGRCARCRSGEGRP